MKAMETKKIPSTNGTIVKKSVRITVPRKSQREYKTIYKWILPAIEAEFVDADGHSWGFFAMNSTHSGMELESYTQQES